METRSEVRRVGESEERVMAAKSTGAQHDEVMPEKIPKRNVERVVVFWGIVYRGRGRESLTSKRVMMPTKIIMREPKR